MRHTCVILFSAPKSDSGRRRAISFTSIAFPRGMSPDKAACSAPWPWSKGEGAGNTGNHRLLGLCFPGRGSWGQTHGRGSIGQEWGPVSVLGVHPGRQSHRAWAGHPGERWGDRALSQWLGGCVWNHRVTGKTRASLFPLGPNLFCLRAFGHEQLFCQVKWGVYRHGKKM